MVVVLVANVFFGAVLCVCEACLTPVDVVALPLVNASCLLELVCA